MWTQLWLISGLHYGHNAMQIKKSSYVSLNTHRLGSIEDVCSWFHAVDNLKRWVTRHMDDTGLRNRLIHLLLTGYHVIKDKSWQSYTIKPQSCFLRIQALRADRWTENLLMEVPRREKCADIHIFFITVSKISFVLTGKISVPLRSRKGQVWLSWYHAASSRWGKAAEWWRLCRLDTDSRSTEWQILEGQSGLALWHLTPYTASAPTQGKKNTKKTHRLFSNVFLCSHSMIGHLPTRFPEVKEVCVLPNISWIFKIKITFVVLLVSCNIHISPEDLATRHHVEFWRLHKFHSGQW